MLVVASKVKEFVKNESGLRTSKEVLEVLSSIVEDALREAMKSAQEAKMGTVKARHFSTDSE